MKYPGQLEQYPIEQALLKCGAFDRVGSTSDSSIYVCYKNDVRYFVKIDTHEHLKYSCRWTTSDYPNDHFKVYDTPDEAISCTFRNTTAQPV